MSAPRRENAALGPIRVGAGGICMLLVGSAVFGGCPEPGEPAQHARVVVPASTLVGAPQFWHDDIHRVSCWMLYDAIACLPDASVANPEVAP